MKSIRICLLAVFFVCLVFRASPCNAHDNGGSTKKHSFTKHFKETFFAITGKAEFSIEILPDEKEYKIGRNMVGIVVHNKHDEDVEGADLTVTVEGMAEGITVKEKGGGLYLASNLDLQRQGTWKLVIQVRNKSVADSAAFMFPAIASKFLPPGQYSSNENK
ncbi:MAG: FixH family protein [Thermodesulfovibrionales bacterium]